MDILGKVIAVCLLIFGVLIIPLQYVVEATESSSDLYVDRIGSEFVEYIRTTGKITRQEYEKFMNQLEKLSSSYEIELEQMTPVYIEEVVEKQKSLNQLSSQGKYTKTVGADRILNLTSSLEDQTINVDYSCSKFSYKEENEQVEVFSYKNDVQTIKKAISNTIDCNDGKKVDVQENKKVVEKVDLRIDDNNNVRIDKNNDMIIGENGDSKVDKNNDTEIDKIDETKKDKNDDSKIDENVDKNIDEDIEKKREIKGIQANLYAVSVPRYSPFPLDSITILYTNGEEKMIEDLWTIMNYHSDCLGEQTVQIIYEEEGLSYSTYEKIQVTPAIRICELCECEYEEEETGFDLGCPVCKTCIVGIEACNNAMELEYMEEPEISIIVTYRDGHTEFVSEGVTSDYRIGEIGIQFVTVSYQGFTDCIMVNVRKKKYCSYCKKEFEIAADGIDLCDDCRGKIISIEVSLNKQILDYGEEELDLIVFANFLDGTRKQVEEYQTTYNPTREGTQEIIVQYGGKTATCTIEVKKVQKLHICDKCGYLYDELKEGENCPKCKKIMTKIRANLINHSQKVNEGDALKLMVVGYYMDGHAEVINQGYEVSGFSPFKKGFQNVLVSYREFTCELVVEVISNQNVNQCDYGHQYFVNGDGQENLCPYCIQVKTDGTERILSYVNLTETAKVVDTLYSEGEYVLAKEDYIHLSIKMKRKITSLQKLFGWLKFGEEWNTYTYTYGGKVL